MRPIEIPAWCEIGALVRYVPPEASWLWGLLPILTKISHQTKPKSWTWCGRHQLLPLLIRTSQQTKPNQNRGSACTAVGTSFLPRQTILTDWWKCARTLERAMQEILSQTSLPSITADDKVFLKLTWTHKSSQLIHLIIQSTMHYSLNL